MKIYLNVKVVINRAIYENKYFITFLIKAPLETVYCELIEAIDETATLTNRDK